MNHKMFFIISIQILLTISLFVGSPFEFQNSIVNSIANYAMIIMIFFLFLILYKKIKRLKKKTIKWMTSIVLLILAIPYTLIGIWTGLMTTKGYQPMWQDLSIYTNQKDDKIISQWRETSGSIYDYRERRVISEFESFRISFNYDIDDLTGEWIKYNIERNTTDTININSIRSTTIKRSKPSP